MTNPEGVLAWAVAAAAIVVFELVQFLRGGTTLTRVVQRYLLTTRPGTYTVAAVLGWLTYHWLLDLGDVAAIDAGVALGSGVLLGELGFRVRRELLERAESREIRRRLRSGELEAKVRGHFGPLTPEDPWGDNINGNPEE